MQTTKNNLDLDELALDASASAPASSTSASVVASANAFIAEQSSLEIVPEAEVSPQQDYNAVFEEHILGSTIRERAFFRLWRLKRTEGWRKVIGISGEKYETWEAVIADVSDAIQVGRQIVFDRIKLYDQLDWLQYTDHEKIVMLSRSPSLYHRLLNRTVDWDTHSREPRSILIPGAEDMDAKQARKRLRDIISDAEKFPRQIDALRYVDLAIMMVPQVRIEVEDDTIRVEYSQTTIDQDGKVHQEDWGDATFYPDKPLPDWVMKHMKKMSTRTKQP